MPQPVAAALDDPLEWEDHTRWLPAGSGTVKPAAAAGATRAPGAEPAARLAESALQMSGMHCAACAGLIEAALMSVDGVQSAHVSAAGQRATVCWDPARTRPSALIAAVQRAGYGAVPDAAAPARALRLQESRQALWRLFVAAFCTMQVMMLATPSYVAPAGDLAPDLRQLLNWGAWLLTLPVLLFSSAPFFQGAWRGLRQRRIGMDVPVAMGILIMFVAGTAATFDPAGPLGHEVYFDSLTMFAAFLLGGRWLELRARHRAAEALEATFGGMPETALRHTADGSLETISVRRLAPGDRVTVPLGAAFPADGTLLQGDTQADEALLSGESVPVPKAPGASLVAGSINLGAPVQMQVLRVGADTRQQAIVAMMRGALAQRPAAARLADRWAGPFMIVVLLLAAGGAAAWSLIDPAKALWVAVAVLIVTCPCALSLSAPAALVAAAHGLARRGVMLQRLDALDALAQVTQVFFDKTGTLTQGVPALGAVTPTVAAQALGLDASALQARAASLAQHSSHPLSQALVQGAVDVARSGFGWTRVQERPGLGLAAQDGEGRQWRLGRDDWATAVGPAAADAPDAPDASDAFAKFAKLATPAAASTGPDGSDPARADDEHAGRVTLACEGVALARFDFDETLRPDALATVQAMQAAGLRLTLLSGDAPERVQRLAQRLGLRAGIDTAVGGASPEAKLAAMAAAQAQGQRVLMVGDGINDAPVLARADVSLAMGQGALVARSQADGVIASDRLGDVVAARRTAQRTVRIVWQNLAWSGAYNLVCIPLALAGLMPPWAAGLGMATSSLLVIANATRAAR